jgi:hypothetical protein
MCVVETGGFPKQIRIQQRLRGHYVYFKNIPQQFDLRKDDFLMAVTWLYKTDFGSPHCGILLVTGQ